MSDRSVQQTPDCVLDTKESDPVEPACQFSGCVRAPLARGLCNGHYIQQHKGQELRPLRSNGRGMTMEQRFWAKVAKTAGCWLWTGATTPKNYGTLWVNGGHQRVHRVSWELANGSIPEGMFVDHRCHNRRCVNPDHLRLVNNAQNLQHRAGPNRGSTSGIRGVTWNKHAAAWEAHASMNGRRYYGGIHPTLESAEAAAKALRAELFTHDDHDQWVSEQRRRD